MAFTHHLQGFSSLSQFALFRQISMHFSKHRVANVCLNACGWTLSNFLGIPPAVSSVPLNPHAFSWPSQTAFQGFLLFHRKMGFSSQNFLFWVMSASSFSSRFHTDMILYNPAGGCQETAPLEFHRLFRPEQLSSGSIIVRNSIIAAKSLSLCL